MEEKKLLVMTSFGPVPFDAVRSHLPKKVVNEIDFILDQDSEISDPQNIKFYINRIAMERNWSYRKMVSYLNNLEKFSPIATFNILLRDIAIYLDSSYEDSIDKAEEIYAISSLDGRIHKVEKNAIKNFRNFAAFRTPEDAKFAHRVLSKKIRKMFRGCGE